MLKLLFVLKRKTQILLSISTFFECYKHLQAYNLFMEVFEAANLINIGRFDAVIGQNMKTRGPGNPGNFSFFCPETRE